MSIKFLIIWNQKAGTSSKATALQNMLFDRPDVRSCNLQDTHSLTDLVTKAAADGASTIVAAGGDGTVNAVAAAMLKNKSSLALGVIPFGTGNDFARTLNIPADPVDAFQLIERGHSTLIDVLRIDVNGAQDFLINVASGGLSTQVSKTNKGLFKKLMGPFSYAMKALATAFGKDRFAMRIVLDDRVHLFRAANLIAANGRFCGGGAEVAPLALLTDGLLDVVIVKDYSPIDLLRLSTKFASGDHIDDERVFFSRVKKITIESRPSFKLSTDGEVKYRTPLTLTVIPKAIKVVGQTVL